MPFIDEAKKVPRRPLTILELDLDFCSLTYSIAPCSATPDPGNECFNTFGTCPVPQDYAEVGKSYRFYTRGPAIVGLDGFPCLERASFAATKIVPGSLGVRASVTVTLQTFPHADHGIDPYVTGRAYTPLAQGDFFAKLRARNEFYVGRPMRLLEGYVTDPLDLPSFRTRHYVIERIDGPTPTGRVTITGKDVLKLADDDRTEVPPATTGQLLAAIGPEDPLVTISDSLASEYTAFDEIRVGDEIMTITSRTGGEFTVTRGVAGTTKDSHELDDQVQAVYHATGHPVDVIETLLNDFTEVDPAFIPSADWATERDMVLPGFAVDAYISEPTGVKTLIEELLVQNLTNMWWDEVDQEIRLRAQTQFLDADATLTDDELIRLKTEVKDDLRQLLTRVQFDYAIADATADVGDFNSYNKHVLRIDAGAEASTKQNTQRQKDIRSRWITAAGLGQVQTVAQRYIDQFAGTPRRLRFELDARHTALVKTGAIIDVASRVVQDARGAPLTTRWQVLEAKPLRAAHLYGYDAFIYPAPVAPIGNTVTVNTACLDIAEFLGFPVEADDFTIIIPLGVTVFSDATGCPAITTGPLPMGSTVTLEIAGDVKGFGGKGGNGGNVTSAWVGGPGFQHWITIGPTNASAGGAGTDAIELTVDTTLNVSTGNIFGGGGGGGAEDGQDLGCTTVGCDPTGTNGNALGGDGGGGGQSFIASNRGAAGVAQLQNGTGAATDGTAGTAGDDSAAGTAGTTDAGDGGAWGASGANGNDTNGGAGGFAVRQNGHTVTFGTTSEAALRAAGQLEGQVA